MARSHLVEYRRKEWITKNGPCIKCGTWDSLEADHIEPHTKSIPVSQVWGLADEELRNQELKKCQVLCYSCHKEKTAKEKEDIVTHGTLHMYNSPKYKCRCTECCAAYSEYQRQYRRSRSKTSKGKIVSSRRKLTDEQIREIRTSSNKNRTLLGKKYGVDGKTITSILLGRSYIDIS